MIVFCSILVLYLGCYMRECLLHHMDGILLLKLAHRNGLGLLLKVNLIHWDENALFRHISDQTVIRLLENPNKRGRERKKVELPNCLCISHLFSFSPRELISPHKDDAFLSKRLFH